MSFSNVREMLWALLVSCLFMGVVSALAIMHHPSVSSTGPVVCVQLGSATFLKTNQGMIELNIRISDSGHKSVPHRCRSVGP